MLFKLLSNEAQVYSSVFWIVMTIGFIGTGISIFAFMPQSLKTIKSKKTNGVSFPTFFIYTLANTLWVIWGILDVAINGHNDLIVILKDSVIIVANIPCAMWAGLILGIKVHNMYKYGEDCKKWKGKIKLPNLEPEPEPQIATILLEANQIPEELKASNMLLDGKSNEIQSEI